MPSDYYDVLGVSRGASADDLRKAYRKLSRENHPDVKPGDDAAAARFKEVQEAYAVLGDDQKRRQYDQFGHQAFRGAGGAGPVDLGDLFGNGGIDLGSLFGGGGMFGGGRARPQKGQDVTSTVQVAFNTAAEGGNYDLTVRIDNNTQTLSIRIPPGIEHGKVIRLSGQGHPGQNGGPAGDLLVTVNVAAHPFFRREGTSLFVDVPVSVTEAMLGARIDVPTLSEGRFTISIPPGCASGTKLRLREKGILDQRNNTRGDLFAVIKIVPPKDLDPETRKLVEQLHKQLDESPRDGLWEV